MTSEAPPQDTILFYATFIGACAVGITSTALGVNEYVNADDASQAKMETAFRAQATMLGLISALFLGLVIYGGYKLTERSVLRRTSSTQGQYRRMSA